MDELPPPALTSQDLLYLATGQRILALQATEEATRKAHLELAEKCERIAKLL
jgi:hypothetical protein